MLRQPRQSFADCSVCSRQPSSAQCENSQTGGVAIGRCIEFSSIDPLPRTEIRQTKPAVCVLFFGDSRNNCLTLRGCQHALDLRGCPQNHDPVEQTFAIGTLL